MSKGNVAHCDVTHSDTVEQALHSESHHLLRYTHRPRMCFTLEQVLDERKWTTRAQIRHISLLLMTHNHLTFKHIERGFRAEWRNRKTFALSSGDHEFKSQRCHGHMETGDGGGELAALSVWEGHTLSNVNHMTLANRACVFKLNLLFLSSSSLSMCFDRLKPMKHTSLGFFVVVFLRASLTHHVRSNLFQMVKTNKQMDVTCI